MLGLTRSGSGRWGLRVTTKLLDAQCASDANRRRLRRLFLLRIAAAIGEMLEKKREAHGGADRGLLAGSRVSLMSSWPMGRTCRGRPDYRN